MQHQPHAGGGIDKDRSNVFVKYLPPDMDNDKFHSLFSSFGKIVSAKVMVDQETGFSLGYGFVRFTYPKEAKRAISTMSGHKINNKTLLCRLSNNLAFPDPSTNLYIKPLPLEMTEAQLIEEYGTFGKIITVKIVREKSPPHTRIGFVRYENVECASKAIDEKNGSKFGSEQLMLTVKYAESETKRALRKANALPKHLAKNNAARANKGNNNHNNTKGNNLHNNTCNNTINMNNIPLLPLPIPITANINTLSINTNNGNLMNFGNTNDMNISPKYHQDGAPAFDSYMIPCYISPHEWYYGQPYNDGQYSRTPYQVLLVPFGDVHVPVYSPRFSTNTSFPTAEMQILPWAGRSFPPSPMQLQ